VHLSGIAEFVFEGDGCRELNEFSKSGACVGESPGGQLDIKIVQRAVYDYFPLFSHASAFPVGRWNLFCFERGWRSPADSIWLRRKYAGPSSHRIGANYHTPLMQ